MQKEFFDKKTDEKEDTPILTVPHLQTSQEIPEPKQVEEPEKQGAVAMKITKCPHTNRKHYAKNMCSSCYRKFGRNQLAWNCEHHDRLNYSVGMCQTCYLSDYHKKRTMKRKAKQLEKSESCKSMTSVSIARINEEIGSVDGQ
jgi:hypothetical protein